MAGVADVDYVCLVEDFDERRGTAVVAVDRVQDRQCRSVCGPGARYRTDCLNLMGLENRDVADGTSDFLLHHVRG